MSLSSRLFLSSLLVESHPYNTLRKNAMVGGWKDGFWCISLFTVSNVDANLFEVYCKVFKIEGTMLKLVWAIANQYYTLKVEVKEKS